MLKWLGIAGTSFALILATATAEPEKEKSRAENNAGKADKRAEQAENKSEKMENKGTPAADDRTQKHEDQRADNPQRDDNAGAANRDQNRVEGRADNRTDTRVEGRADNRTDTRVEGRADNRTENRTDRQVYKKGEFKEHFQDRDRDRIVTYFTRFKDREHGLPPELSRNWEGRKRLPSGWRDRLVTGYVIEDSWLPAFEPVPYDWFPEIAVIPDTRLYWYGDRIVRVYEPTREVVDVIIIPTIHVDL